MAIDMWKKNERESRELAHARYIADPLYPAAVKEAASRGFRPATISESRPCLEGGLSPADLFRWRGGLWVKQTDAAIAKAGAQ